MTDSSWTTLIAVGVCVWAAMIAAERGWFSWAAHLTRRAGRRFRRG